MYGTDWEVKATNDRETASRAVLRLFGQGNSGSMEAAKKNGNGEKMRKEQEKETKEERKKESVKYRKYTKSEAERTRSERKSG